MIKIYPTELSGGCPELIPMMSLPSAETPTTVPSPMLQCGLQKLVTLRADSVYTLPPGPIYPIVELLGNVPK